MEGPVQSTPSASTFLAVASPGSALPPTEHLVACLWPKLDGTPAANITNSSMLRLSDRYSCTFKVVLLEQETGYNCSYGFEPRRAGVRAASSKRLIPHKSLMVLNLQTSYHARFFSASIVLSSFLLRARHRSDKGRERYGVETRIVRE